MSQIETIMLVILGFAVALLVAMLLGKLLWGQAIGLGKRRSRRETPQTIAALQAEKDQLRAESAMLSRKLELRLNDLKTRLAEQTAEVSRNRNRVDLLVGEIKDRDTTISKRDDEIEALKNQMIPMEKELVTRTQSAQKLKEKLRDAQEQLSQKTHLIDDLQDQLSTTIKTASIVGPADASARDTIEHRISDLTALSRQIEEQRVQLTQQHSELSSLTDVITKTKSTKKPKDKKTVKDSYIDEIDTGSRKLEAQLLDAERETDKLQKELSQMDDDWNQKLKELDEAKSNSGKKADKKPAKKKRKSKKASGKADKSDESEDDGDKSNIVSLAHRIRSLQRDITGK